MFQVRIHGRGGQGVVTGAELLSIAAFLEGRHSQAFPSFGSERMGAPVVAFCRISNSEIRLREPVMTPDALIIQDPTLLHQVDLFSGLSKSGYILINSGKSFDELGLSVLFDTYSPDRLVAVPATEIALKHIGRPLPNSSLLAGFCALTGEVGIDSLKKAISEKFSGNTARNNISAAEAAFSFVRENMHVAAD
ncbi:MAG TPA: 2-oxoacid:acceptor oxidoreductase family protein [Burkholderiales bacterium]|nr:2-oxoacid:acceptor oxidoreductase family protein [Burkholderiales bacterium]